ncbi:DUF4118 domain-containing protein [Nostoc sp.]|uniref:DUF4118 domain-containing protein n=1 Tax=Nostoc sp. TaxID=1180 RepID=UPI002FF4813D
MKGIRSLLAPYAVASLAVGSVLLLTLLLQPLLKQTIFLLFFAAVAVSAWYGGMEAGLLATALSTLAVSYFFLEPVFSLLVASLDNIVGLGLFEKSSCRDQNILDPPKSPDKLGDFDSGSPLFKGG